MIRSYSLNDVCILKGHCFSRVYKIGWPDSKQMSLSLLFPRRSHLFFLVEESEASFSGQSCKTRSKVLKETRHSGKAWNLRQVFACPLFRNSVNTTLPCKLNPHNSKDNGNFIMWLGILLCLSLPAMNRSLKRFQWKYFII